jgi:nuclear cap-binding protein subunit 1
VDGEPVLGENPVRVNRLKSRAEKAQEELVSIQESVEAKEALLGRATDENEVIDVKFSVVNSLETFFLIKGDT